MNIRKYSTAILAMLATVFHTAAMAQTEVISKNLPNFYKVSDAVYRGGQPKDLGFAELKRMGIRTVINLRQNDGRNMRQKTLVETAGMRFINHPLSNWNRPSVDDINKIIRAINSPENHPVFVHCRRGSDRAGTVIAVYRMTTEGKTAKDATDEADTFGFGWWQFGMRDFIHDYYRDSIRKNEARN